MKTIDASKKYSNKSQEIEFSVLAVSDSKNETVSIYPNPVKGILNVKTASKIKTHKVYNLSGQIVNAKLISDKTVDFSRLEKGIYVVEIQLENGKKITQKIIKTNNQIFISISTFYKKIPFSFLNGIFDFICSEKKYKTST